MNPETDAADDADWREVESAAGPADATWLALDRASEDRARALGLAELLDELVSADGGHGGIARTALLFAMADLRDHVEAIEEAIVHAGRLVRPQAMAEKAAAAAAKRSAEPDTPEAMEAQAATFERMAEISTREAAEWRARAADARQGGSA